MKLVNTFVNMRSILMTMTAVVRAGTDPLAARLDECSAHLKELGDSFSTIDDERLVPFINGYKKMELGLAKARDSLNGVIVGLREATDACHELVDKAKELDVEIN